MGHVSLFRSPVTTNTAASAKPSAGTQEGGRSGHSAERVEAPEPLADPVPTRERQGHHPSLVSLQRSTVATHSNPNWISNRRERTVARAVIMRAPRWRAGAPARGSQLGSTALAWRPVRHRMVVRSSNAPESVKTAEPVANLVQLVKVWLATAGLRSPVRHEQLAKGRGRFVPRSLRSHTRWSTLSGPWGDLAITHDGVV